ncbi:hypothetical protein GCM10025886_12760 [Tetragenococcus halophilus subsp. flandriensis]|uniref:hypothetical protein n=1 Tax=Tetragenococcus halophilus TaxID=51669 RepID=UPI0023E905DF|nr:hypothetical protein [Tetragenococcus halophilus]GMA08125.1 hypothetical protein GCM10025886_12760 [Tetragenococcus halophilus subsp. flandriensis]
MKKVYVLLFGALLLTACSQNETETNSVAESSDTVETTTQTSESSSSEQSSETSTQSTEESTEESSSEEDEEDYAVDLDDFYQGEDPAGKPNYHQKFATSQDDLPPGINVNTNAVNDSGKELSVRLPEGESERSIYSVSTTAVPTKEITLTGDNGEKREVKVNTEVEIEKYEDHDDPLQIDGDDYYLFYNDEGTMSLATRNFNENPGEEDLDNKNMVEYVQDEPSTAEDTTEESSEDNSEEDEAKAEEYHDAISDAWQEQQDYIDSLEDPKEKQSVQTPESAANMEARRLEMENSDDTEIINESLKKVLNGE